MKVNSLLRVLVILALGTPMTVQAQDMRPQPGDVPSGEPQYSPYAGRQFPTRVFWGDTHGKAPSFLAAAMKDPLSGNLDRIQIIKGWLDEDGGTHERVYDVAWSGDRSPAADGKLPPVGNTVDVANATWSNSIGAPELITVWTDPDFDPGQAAFYYARVIEIPTPRWTAYEAKRFGLGLPDHVPMAIQERAYTSPIWYTP